MRTRFLILAIALAWVAGTRAAAQDSHYWGNTYGTQSSLLGGAVIGSVSDVSGTYYNPGALALNRKPSQFLAAKAWELGTLNVKAGGGPGVDVGTTTSGPAPDLVAGELPFHWRSGDRLAYSVLTRQSTDLRLQARFGLTADVAPSEPGDEMVGVETTFEQNFSDLWTGLTWSVPLGSKVGIGLTQYVAVRSQRGRLQSLVQGLSGSGAVAAATSFVEFDYMAWRAITKAGLAVDLSPLTFGVNVTSPGVHLLGSGTVAVDTAIVGVDMDGDGIEDPRLVANQQRDVAARYRTPLSVGIGAGYTFGRSTLHVSGEWFDAVEVYDVLDTEPFTVLNAPTVVSRPVRHRAKSVVNVGAGVSHRFREGLQGFAAYSTDKSSFETGSHLSVGGWDVQHLFGGAEFTVSRTQLLLGLGYSWGQEDLASLADPSGPVGTSAIGVRYSRYRAVFGFSFGGGAPSAPGSP